MQETFAKQSFAILQFFGKFAKVWNLEIFDLVAFTKVNFCKNMFAPKAFNYNIHRLLLVLP